MWTLSQSLKWRMTLFREGYCPLNPVKTGEHHRRNMCHYVSPVWATMCVQPLHAWITFSPPSSERFTRVGEDRKGSVAVSWPCLLLPHRNKSPSPAHTTGAPLLFIQQTQQQKGRAVIEWCWTTNYRAEGRPDMMYEHEVEDNQNNLKVNVLPTDKWHKIHYISTLKL